MADIKGYKRDCVYHGCREGTLSTQSSGSFPGLPVGHKNLLPHKRPLAGNFEKMPVKRRL